jgi:putative DNA primase/helicase
MAGYDNLHQVLLQMQQFGIELKNTDAVGFPKRIGKRVTCGKGGKDWYKVYEFTPDAGGLYLTGSLGTYRHGGSFEKIEVDWKPLGDAERERLKAERAAAAARAAAERAAEIANAALQAIDIWRKGSRTGRSEYLERKGLQGESCRYLAEQLILRWPAERPGDEDTVVRLTGGTLLLPLVRLDYPKEEALRGLQFIKPDGFKLYLRGFDKPGCCVRLGEAGDAPRLLLVCEGYATGLSIRLGTGHEFPVFVAFDAGNLAHVVPLLRGMYPLVRLLVCADDDWKTFDPKTGRLNNPGRTAATKVAKATPGCDLVWPVFNVATRQVKDTDFDDLRQREGLHTVRRQLRGVIEQMGRVYG